MGYDWHLCRICYDAWQTTDFQKLAVATIERKRAEGALRSRLADTIERLNAEYELVSELLKYRDFVLPDSADYRFGRTIGLREAALPTIEPHDGFVGDAHQWLLQAPFDLERRDDYRLPFTSAYSWAIPNQDALAIIKTLSPDGIVDFGCGSGYWSALLRASGVEVRSMELPTHARNFTRYNSRASVEWTQIEHIKDPLTELVGLARKALLLVWPPEKNAMAFRALRAWRGERLIYIGNVAPGVTGTPEFFDELKRQYRQTHEIAIPTFYGYYDRLMAFRRA